MHAPVKKGMLLRHQGHYYWVEDVKERHTGQQRPTIHVFLREAFDNRHIDRVLDELMPIEEASFARRAVQFLYAKGETRVFMDNESFEEIELSGQQLRGFEPFLKEGDEYQIFYIDDRPVQLELPDSVAIKIADTAAPSHAVGTSANIMKEARLENGLDVRVPLFLKTGDLVRVNTHTREYLGKA